MLNFNVKVQCEAFDEEIYDITNLKIFEKKINITLPYRTTQVESDNHLFEFSNFFEF